MQAAWHGLTGEHSVPLMLHCVAAIFCVCLCAESKQERSFADSAEVVNRTEQKREKLQEKTDEAENF